MQEKPKNRDWVKNAAIIFLAVLLVLTFFSNTIMNRSLPEVATQGVTDGNIVARVRGTGIVTANANTQVKMEKTRVIRSVLVKVGQQVEAGDVLFTLGEGSSEEIDAAEEKLQTLQASYNRTAATIPDYSYTTDNRKIGLLEDKLSEAAENLAVAKKAAAAATPYAEQVAYVEQELERAVKARDAAREEYEKERGTAEDQTIHSIEYYANLGSIDAMETVLDSTHDDMVVQELDNFQVAIIKVLVDDSKGSKLDGDLLNDSLYGDRDKIDTQIDRVEALLDGAAYTIIFKNDDETPLQSSTLSYGAVPAYSYGTPTCSKDNSTETYPFLKWVNEKDTSKGLAIVTEDATYIATYSATPVVVEEEDDSEETSDGTTITINTDSIVVNVNDNGGGDDSDNNNSNEDLNKGLTLTATTDVAETENSASQNADANDTDIDNVSADEIGTDSADLTESNLAGENATLYTKGEDEDLNDISVSATFQAGEELASVSIDPNTEENSDINEQANSTEQEESVDQSTEPTSPVTGEKSRSELEEWLKLLEKALEIYDEAESYKYSKEQILNNLKAAYDAAVAEAEKWATALDTYLLYGSAESAVYKTAQEAYTNAKDAYDTAVETLNQKRADHQTTLNGYNADLANIWQQIQKAKEKLTDLMGGQEAQILAKVAGTIQTIDAAPGDTKQKDDVLATIEAPDMGYSLSFSVTNDQASRLRPGDTATVSNFYWGTEIVATLNSIKIDQKNPQTNKLLTFDLSGNVTAGSELTLSVGQKSANYDIIIPSSAIRTDANGSFVLKVESKNSPLGNRYIAKRVPVEVLASDDSNSAVSADLSFGDYVITTSTAPIKSGSLIRLANS